MKAAAPAPSPLVPVLVAGALLMENVDATVLNTVTKTIATDFGVGPLQLKFALTAYLVSLSVGIPVSGRLADRFGPRRVFSLALTLFALGSLCCGLAPGLEALVLARLLQGAGGALMVPVARLVLLRSYPKDELVRITNLTALPALFGPMLGPLLGGAVATWYGWRAVFFINVPFCVGGLWLTRRILPSSERGERLHIDGVAFVTFALALIGSSFAFEATGDTALSSSAQALLWAGALTGVAAFAAYTHVYGDHFLQLSLFSSRTFRLGVIGNLISRLNLGATPFLLPLMMQLRFNYTPLQAAISITPLSVGMLAARSSVRPVLRRLGFRRVLVANTLLLGASQAGLSLLGIHLALPARVALVLLYGAFASLHFACMNVLAYVDVEQKDMAAATSIVSTVHTFALGAGIALGAFIVGFFLHNHAQLPGGPAFAFHRTFALLGAGTAASALLFHRLREEDGELVSGHRASQATKRP